MWWNGLRVIDLTLLLRLDICFLFFFFWSIIIKAVMCIFVHWSLSVFLITSLRRNIGSGITLTLIFRKTVPAHTLARRVWKTHFPVSLPLLGMIYFLHNSAGKSDLILVLTCISDILMRLNSLHLCIFSFANNWFMLFC